MFNTSSHFLWSFLNLSQSTPIGRPRPPLPTGQTANPCKTTSSSSSPGIQQTTEEEAEEASSSSAGQQVCQGIVGLFIEGPILRRHTLHTKCWTWKTCSVFVLLIHCNAVIHGPGYTHLCDLERHQLGDERRADPEAKLTETLILVDICHQGSWGASKWIWKRAWHLSNLRMLSSLPNFRQIKLFLYFPDIKFEFKLRRKEQQQQQQGGFLDFLIPSFLKGSPKKRPPPPPQARHQNVLNIPIN